jgi:hypothetical protein
MSTETTQDDNTVVNAAEEPIVEQKPKTKNPKRIEQGKKLAEWNRKNKAAKKPDSPVAIEKFANSPVELPVIDTPVIDTPVKKPVSKKPLQENYWVMGGVIIVGGLFVGTLYFINRGADQVSSAPQISTPQVSAPQTDPFDMD